MSNVKGNDIDDLFKRASDKYPLRTDSADWDRLAADLEKDPSLIVPPPNMDGDKRRRRRFFWLFLLIPLGVGGLVYYASKQTPARPEANAHIVSPAQQSTASSVTQQATAPATPPATTSTVQPATPPAIATSKTDGNKAVTSRTKVSATPRTNDPAATGGNDPGAIGKSNPATTKTNDPATAGTRDATTKGTSISTITADVNVNRNNKPGATVRHIPGGHILNQNLGDRSLDGRNSTGHNPGNRNAEDRNHADRSLADRIPEGSILENNTPGNNNPGNSNLEGPNPGRRNVGGRNLEDPNSWGRFAQVRATRAPLTGAVALDVTVKGNNTGIMAKDSSGALKSNNNKKNRASNKKQTFFYAGLIVAPDLSTIKFQSIKGTGTTFGVLLGYQLNRKWAIETGAYYDHKKYYTDGEYFKKESTNPSYKLLNVDGSCNMWEIPINIRYNLSMGEKTKWFATAGLSTYLMTSERYVSTYSYNGSVWPYPWNNKNSSQYWLSIINMSIGYEQKLGKIGNLRLEPYLRIPLKGMGSGSLPIMSAGLNIGITRRIW